MTKIGIHIFHKDLRTYDNTALYKCAEMCDTILGVFIIDPKQTSDEEHKFYRSYNALRFILESLTDLSKQTDSKLWICTISEFIKYVKNTDNVSVISYNVDHTKYALKRDKEISDFALSMNIECVTSVDHLLTRNMITKIDGTPYSIFSFFYKKAKKIRVDKPRGKNIKWSGAGSHYKSIDIKKMIQNVNKYASPLPFVIGGRKKGLSVLTKSKTKKINSSIITSDNGTMLAPYLNFGCLSIRETYYVLSRKQSIVKNLYWRDFYATILATSKISREYIWLDPRYNKLKWRTVKEFKHEWEQMWNSKTGFHLVDASTRQLRETGYLPNRARMIWAWFCIRYLQINPFDKKYGAMNIFSRFLVDASTSQNKFNFEWMMSSLDLAGRRFARGLPLAGRWLDVSNKAISKYHAKDWINKWLTQDELLLEPMFDKEKRYEEWVRRIRRIS